MKQEVLPPEPWHDGVGYLMPHPVKVWRVEQHSGTRVKFEDGGVWSISDRELQHIDPSDVHANIAEIFARWPARFSFVKRERGGYAHRQGVRYVRP